MKYCIFLSSFFFFLVDGVSNISTEDPRVYLTFSSNYLNHSCMKHPWLAAPKTGGVTINVKMLFCTNYLTFHHSLTPTTPGNIFGRSGGRSSSAMGPAEFVCSGCR